MGEETFDKFKRFIAGIGFKLMLWGNDMTKETYWHLIYEQEKEHKRNST